MTIRFYCEDGKDNVIEVFDDLESALQYALTDERVLEIHKYEDKEDDDFNIEHLGCIWKREGWDGFQFTAKGKEN